MAFSLSNKHLKENIYTEDHRQKISNFINIIENIIPKKTPVIVAKNPIVKPVKKNDFIIDFSDNPNGFYYCNLFCFVFN